MLDLITKVQMKCKRETGREDSHRSTATALHQWKRSDT